MTAVPAFTTLGGGPTVLMLHGIGGGHLAFAPQVETLATAGYRAVAWDMPGYGHSAPIEPYTFKGLAASCIQLIEALKCEQVILLGHSMGGLIASTFVQRDMARVDGLVLSSPALDAGLSRFQRLLLDVLPRIAPNLTVGNGLEVHAISHDPEVVRAYQADPRVHGRISGRLARFIADGGPAVVAQASHWHVPTLLMYAGSDRLVNPAGSRAFAQAAPPAVVESDCFEPLFHEIFNEPEEMAAPVFERLQAWLDQRF